MAGASAQTQARLAAGVSPADCAAMLAEAIPPGATLVIDDLHHLEDRPPALAVLRPLMRAVAPDALVEATEQPFRGRRDGGRGR